MERNKKAIGAILAALIIASGGFLGGYAFGARSPEGVPVSSVANATVPQDIDAGDFGMFWKAWRLLDAAHYNTTSTTDTPQERVYGAIRGMVASLGDPHTEFFSPEENQRFSEAVQGSFGGVGIELGIKDGTLVVIAPLKDTPAARAGVKAGDLILQIDGKSTDQVSVTEAVNLIRGQEGSVVKMTLLSEGDKATRTVELTRQRIEVPSVKVTMEGRIAHVELYEFTADAGAKFGEAVRGLPQDTQGIVLDLRNNPGGFLEVSVDIAGWFVPRGSTIVKEAEKDGNVVSFSAKGPSTLENLPVVVLVNAGSASASEILAGALRDLRKAPLVGVTTFGKGTVQEVRDLPGGNGASIKVTVAEWLTPNGAHINKIGLEPDVKVEAGDDPAKDPQLQKALEVARNQFSR